MIRYKCNIIFYKEISKKAIVVYVLALLSCLMLYSQYSLDAVWCFFGLVEVVSFFYFAYSFSAKWRNFSTRHFENKIFISSFLIRVIYVFFSYEFYCEMNGCPYEFEAADVIYYDEIARFLAGQIKNGNFDLLSLSQTYGGATLSDSGYGIYLSIVYLISDNSILFARMLKAVWGAWTVLLVYRLSCRNFGDPTARIAAVMCMLMPNLIFYCGLHLKEIEMVFLVVLFAERADFILRKGKLTIGPTIALMLIPLAMFTIRTALAAVMILAFCTTLLLGNSRVVSKSRRILLMAFMVVFGVTFILGGTKIGSDIREMWQTRDSQQKINMEWRSQRKDSKGRVQKFAKYAGAAVFAPMIFTIPFPTMVETDGQKNQKMIHGGNFDKNITSFFTILSLFLMLLTGDWRKYVLPISLMTGYLVVLAFSNFAQSERFHLPSVPFSLMFAAYSISSFRTKREYQRWFSYWCVLMFVASIAWNWFKLAGRGMI